MANQTNQNTNENNSGKSSTFAIAVLLGVILLIGAFLLLGMLGDDEPATNVQNEPAQIDSAHNVDGSYAQTNSVSYTANGFQPVTIRIQAGDTVTWTNQDSNGIIVASDPHPVHTDVPGFESETLNQNDTYQFTFQEAGTFTYHNHLNPGLRGTVIVE